MVYLKRESSISEHIKHTYASSLNKRAKWVGKHSNFPLKVDCKSFVEGLRKLSHP